MARRRLCKGCRDALGKTWAQRGVEGCVVCGPTEAEKVARTVSERVTVSAIGGDRRNGNRGTDGWEYLTNDD